MNDYYVGDNGIARVGDKPYIGINDVAENVIKGYVGDANGIARLWYMRKPACALYWLGDECTSLTGGWEVIAMPTSEKTNRNVSYTASAPTKYTHQQHDDSGQLFSNPKAMEAYKTSNRTAYSGGIKTINKIDLSAYAYIYVICDLLYTDGTDNYINIWKVAAFGDGITDYSAAPLNQTIYQNPTNDHWIYTYNQYTGLSKFNRVQKVYIPSDITSSVYVALRLLTNASMTVRHSIAVRAMWADGHRTWNRGNFYYTISGASMSDYVIDRSIPTVGTWPTDLTVNVRQYFGTSKILMIGQDHATVWAKDSENIKYTPPSSGACTCVLCIPIPRIYGARTITVEWKTTRRNSDYQSQFGCLKINSDLTTTQHGATPSLTPETSWTLHTINIPSTWEYVDYITITAVTWTTEVRSISIE